MGYREYLCIPHPKSTHRPHPEDFEQSVTERSLDIFESSSSAQKLLELFRQLETEELFDNPSNQDIKNRLQHFLAEPREKHTTEFDAEHFQTLCSVFLQTVQSPPPALRKRYRIGTGALTPFLWVEKISNLVFKHRTCSNIIRLEGHD